MHGQIGHPGERLGANLQVGHGFGGQETGVAAIVFNVAFTLVPPLGSNTLDREAPVLSFDYLVSKGKKRRRQIDPQRLRGLEIDDQLERAGLVIGNFARLLSPQNPVDLTGSVSKKFL
jgi:hypothetical protein